MRYIVVSYNPAKPDDPNVRTFASRRKACEFAEQAEHTCRVYYVSGSLEVRPAWIEDDTDA